MAKPVVGEARAVKAPDMKLFIIRFTSSRDRREPVEVLVLSR